MSTCGIEDTANELMEELTKDVKIELPYVNLSGDEFKFPGDIYSDLYKKVTPVSNEALTERKVNGEGTFDALMAGANAHIESQYEKGRINADDYAEVYTKLIDIAMSNAVQFALQKDTNFWASQTAQIQAITARIQLEAEKARLAMFYVDALKAKTSYALAKSELAISSVEHCVAKYRFENMLPKEEQVLSLQVESLELDNEAKQYTNLNILPAQKGGLDIDNDTKEFNLNNILTVDYSTRQFQLSQMLPAQLKLTTEQYEVQRAQTLDSRSDNATVQGTLGKQKELYDEQIESYKRNAETNAAKIFADAWITQKTLDEGLLPPDSLNNASVNQVMTAIKTANGLS